MIPRHTSYLTCDVLFSILDCVKFEDRQGDFFLTILTPASINNQLIFTFNEY